MVHCSRAFIALAVCGLVGCASSPSPNTSSSHITANKNTDAANPTQVTKSSSGIRNIGASPKGVAFVAMYHHLGDRKDTMFRSSAAFLHDLQTLDNLKFRPVTASDFLSGSLPIPAGTSPVVMTFDDSNPDQVRFLANGTLDPTCFLGLWQGFAATHPEFPIRATFFVLPNVLFGQSKWTSQKIALLHKLGCEIDNHTTTHPILRKLTDSQVEAEIGGAAQTLAADGVSPTGPLALPYGVSPKNPALLKDGFQYKGITVKPSGVFLVGANPAPMPGEKGFNPMRIPRIQANDVPYGLTFWLKMVSEGKVHPFVMP